MPDEEVKWLIDENVSLFMGRQYGKIVPGSCNWELYTDRFLLWLILRYRCVIWTLECWSRIRTNSIFISLSRYTLVAQYGKIVPGSCNWELYTDRFHQLTREKEQIAYERYKTIVKDKIFFQLEEMLYFHDFLERFTDGYHNHQYLKYEQGIMKSHKSHRNQN